MSCRPSRDRSHRWNASTSCAKAACCVRTRRMETGRVQPSFCGPACTAASPRRSPGRPWRTWWSSPTSTRRVSRSPAKPHSATSLQTPRQRRQMADLEITNLHVSAEDKEILKGLDLEVSKGKIHALMGPNGSGKSTLANAIMGHPSLEVTAGEILYAGEDITEAAPEERARAGLFMAFQYPVAIPGVTVAKYLRMVMSAHREAHCEKEVSLK